MNERTKGNGLSAHFHPFILLQSANLLSQTLGKFATKCLLCWMLHRMKPLWFRFPKQPLCFHSHTGQAPTCLSCPPLSCVVSARCSKTLTIDGVARWASLFLEELDGLFVYLSSYLMSLFLPATGGAQVHFFRSLELASGCKTSLDWLNSPVLSFSSCASHTSAFLASFLLLIFHSLFPRSQAFPHCA